MKNLTLTTLLALAAAPALAHPGHGEAGPTHWVSDLSHMAALAALVLASYVAALAIAAWRAHRK